MTIGAKLDLKHININEINQINPMQGMPTDLICRRELAQIQTREPIENDQVSPIGPIYAWITDNWSIIFLLFVLTLK